VLQENADAFSSSAQPPPPAQDGLPVVSRDAAEPALAGEIEHAAPAGAGVSLRLEQAVETTKARPRDTLAESETSTQELKASNEELQALNEELRSATVELETSREKLNSVNEELIRVNQELNHKVEELDHALSDMHNLMSATDVATVFLDRELRITRFTPSAESLFHFISTDLGRPLSDLSRKVDYPEIMADAEKALTSLTPVEREVRAAAHCFHARTLAYRTTDDRIAGVVITFTDITTLKRAEESTARLAAIVESSSDAIVGKDLRGIVTSWNGGAEKIFGYTAAEMIGQPIVRLIPAERQAEETEILRRIAAGDTIQSFETVRVRKDGASVRISLTVSPIKDASGKIIGASKVARDISAAERTAEALRASEERLRLATDAAELGIWTWHPQTDRVVWENDWPYEILDIPRGEQAINAAHFAADLVHPEDRAAFERAVAEAQQPGARFYFKGRLRRPDGESRWIEFTGKRVPGPEGAPASLVGTAQNVTAREQTEAALRQNAALFNDIIDQAPLGAYVVDADFRVKQVNSVALPAFVSVNPLIGRNFDEVMEILWGPERGGEFARIFRRTLMTGERCISPRFSAQRHDIGEEQAFEWETQRVTLPDGRHGVVCYFSDVTERHRIETALQQAKEEAEAANASKDRFLAVLSHELRTPLTPVLMIAGALEHDPDLPPEVREDLAMIKRNVELETKLIDDLLDLSRITSGKVELKPESVDLNEAVRQVCGICQPHLIGAQVRLEMELGEDVGTISADPARLQQVLWNLLKNAIKFSPQGGSVRVTSQRRDSQRCEVRVQDRGIGIPPEILPRVFNAFEQGDARITRQFGGLGLGLAISRALVELHDGTIRAESAGPGQGATFTVELPGEAASPASKAPAAHGEKGAGARRTRLLLVEDHADTARALTRILHAAGMTVVTACDVATALAAFDREPFDLVVSDLGLPDGDGYEVMRAIRARRIVPGIAMSGYGMDEDIRRTQEAGFAEHLVKPIAVPQLIAAIGRLTESRERHSSQAREI